MNLNMLKRWYRGNSWAVTQDPQKADFIIVATCGFSQSEEDHEIAALKNLMATKKEDCEVIVTGCLPQINKSRVKEIFQGPCVKTVDMKAFNQIMNFGDKIEQYDNHYVSEDEYNTDPTIHHYFKMRKNFEKYSFLPLVKVPKVLYTVPSEKWFLIRCAMGCTGNCSYCGIKHAHGAIQSEPMESILAQASKGITQGFQEIALTGEDQGGYGVDIGIDLSVLLTELLRLPGDFVINLRYIDPYWLHRLKDKLLPVFETGRIKAFCSPVQSGSDRILKLMNRLYTYDQIKETVSEVMATGNVGMISTNIIVGFPTETEEDFEQSMRLVEEVPFGMFMAFKYEDRPGTKASELEGKISPEVMDQRYNKLEKLIKRKHLTQTLWGK